jgi:twitching motility protein PilT
MPFIDINDNKPANTNNKQAISAGQPVVAVTPQVPVEVKTAPAVKPITEVVTDTPTPINVKDDTSTTLDIDNTPEVNTNSLPTVTKIDGSIVTNISDNGVKEISNDTTLVDLTETAKTDNTEFADISNELDKKIKEIPNELVVDTKEPIPPDLPDPLNVKIGVNKSIPTPTALPQLEEQRLANEVSAQNALQPSLPNAPAQTLNGVPTSVDKIESNTAKTWDSSPYESTGAVGTTSLQNRVYSLAELIKDALSKNASDLHLNVGYRAMARIDGVLTALQSQEITEEHINQYASEVLKDRKDADLKTLKQYDLTYVSEDVRLRVNVFRQRGTLSIAFRLIPEVIKTVEELNLPSIIKSFCKFPNGLVLVTGPTGSGKSTTIASLINLINLTESKHIITIEDPIEYVYPKGLGLIDQREYGSDFDSWPDALRSVLRQDPDIVLVGEMRDLATIESALQVAETGHLVFATLHTNSASETINRIIDIFPSTSQEQVRTLLSSVIRAVICQKLIPLANGGRRPVLEVMIANSAIKNSIRDRKVFQIDNIIQTSQEEGMISMEQSLVELVRSGLISIEKAKESTPKSAEIDILLRKS